MEGFAFHVLRSPFCVLTNFCFCCHVYFQSRNQVLFRISRPLQVRTDGFYDQTILGRKLVNPNVRQSLVTIVITEQQRNSVRYYRLDQGSNFYTQNLIINQKDNIPRFFFVPTAIGFSSLNGTKCKKHDYERQYILQAMMLKSKAEKVLLHPVISLFLGIIVQFCEKKA